MRGCETWESHFELKTPRRTGRSHGHPPKKATDGLQPTLQVLRDLGKSRGKTEAAVKEDEDGNRVEVLEALYQRCQAPRSLVTAPWKWVRCRLPNPRSSVFSRLALSRRHIRHCTELWQPSQKKVWCHVPVNNTLPKELARPEEARLCSQPALYES